MYHTHTYIYIYTYTYNLQCTGLVFSGINVCGVNRTVRIITFFEGAYAAIAKLHLEPDGRESFCFETL